MSPRLRRGLKAETPKATHNNRTRHDGLFFPSGFMCRYRRHYRHRTELLPPASVHQFLLGYVGYHPNRHFYCHLRCYISPVGKLERTRDASLEHSSRHTDLGYCRWMFLRDFLDRKEVEATYWGTGGDKVSGTILTAQSFGLFAKFQRRAEQPEPPAGTIHGIANDGAIIVQFYGDEWKNIAAFRLTSEDKHGGATGRLTMCSSMKRHSLDPGMSQRTLMGTESNGPPAPSAERVSDAGHMV